VNAVVLSLLLLRATGLSFSGFASVPVIREDLVVTRGVLTDEELNSAIAISQASPGPLGLYVIVLGYFVAGVPGALAGAFALATPAILTIPTAARLGWAPPAGCQVAMASGDTHMLMSPRRHRLSRMIACAVSKKDLRCPKPLNLARVAASRQDGAIPQPSHLLSALECHVIASDVQPIRAGLGRCNHLKRNRPLQFPILRARNFQHGVRAQIGDDEG
jgi:hypothetical protein